MTISLRLMNINFLSAIATKNVITFFICIKISMFELISKQEFMHSSRIRTARSLTVSHSIPGGYAQPTMDADTSPGCRPLPECRPPDADPHRCRLPWMQLPWIQTPLDGDLLDADPLDADALDAPWMQTP